MSCICGYICDYERVGSNLYRCVVYIGISENIRGGEVKRRTREVKRRGNVRVIFRQKNTLIIHIYDVYINVYIG